jgi:hypothetical protein
MKIESIWVGDIVKFKTGKEILHGRVNAKGKKFLIQDIPPNDNDVLYVTVFEHPEWKDVTILASQVIEIIFLPEVVRFT